MKFNLKKILLFFSLFLILSSIIIFYNLKDVKRFLAVNLSPNISTLIRIITNSDGHLFEHYNNDYLVKFLPRTQFINLDLKKIKLNFLKEGDWINYPYSFDLYNDKLIILTQVEGKMFTENIQNIYKNQNTSFSEINTNLSDFTKDASQVKFPDLFLKNNKIYLLLNKVVNNCGSVSLMSGKLLNENINFEEIFSTKFIKECIEIGTANGAGRINAINHQNKEYLSITLTHKSFTKNTYKKIEEKKNEKIYDFGNILLINEKDGKFIEFARGFRNILGLYADDKVVIATDNGPKGGDEINKVEFGKHYGWPYASYGEPYGKPNLENKNAPKIEKDHNKNGFEEPTYSFIYALGIAEIIKLSNNFSEYWQNNFLVSTLNSKHLLRIKFDDEFNKIIYNEKIYVGERIRDLKYDEKNKTIILALTSSGSLGILKKKNNL